MAGTAPLSLSRRALASLAASAGLVGAAGGAVGCSTAQALPEADVALLIASAAFCRLEARWQELDADRDADTYDAATADIQARQEPHLETLVHTLGTGMAAHQARAAAIVAWSPDWLHHPDTHAAGRMLRALLRDLLGMTDEEA